MMTIQSIQTKFEVEKLGQMTSLRPLEVWRPYDYAKVYLRCKESSVWALATDLTPPPPLVPTQNPVPKHLTLDTIDIHQPPTPPQQSQFQFQFVISLQGMKSYDQSLTYV